MGRLVNKERDTTLAAVAKDAITYGSYTTALENARQITDIAVRDDMLLALVRDSLARGLYDIALETAALLQGPKIRQKALREIADQAKRFGLFDHASQAALLMETPAPAARAEIVPQPQKQQPTIPQSAPTHHRRSLPWVMGTCGLTAGLWAVGFALHGHNMHEWLTTQVDGFAGTAFVMTISSAGAVAYEWWNRRN